MIKELKEQIRSLQASDQPDDIKLGDMRNVYKNLVAQKDTLKEKKKAAKQ